MNGPVLNAVNGIIPAKTGDPEVEPAQRTHSVIRDGDGLLIEAGLQIEIDRALPRDDGQ